MRVKLDLVPRRGAPRRGTSPTTAFGTFTTSFALDKEVPLGTFEVTATGTVGGGRVQYGGSFRVEEYRAPQFRVDVSTPERSLVAGDPIQGTVLARYLFGGPMADAEVAWTVNRATLDFRPPGNDGFAFGNQVGWWDDGEPGPTREVAGSGQGADRRHGRLRDRGRPGRGPGGPDLGGGRSRPRSPT